MPETLLVVSIDCECDKGPAWRSQRPMSFEGVHEGIGRRLQPLFERYGATPTYLLSPEVIRDDASAALLRSLGDRAELGTHLHGEYAEPNAFEPDVTTVFQRDYPRDVELAKLTYTTDLFARAFGRAPRSFRAGRFGLGPNTLGILASLGYEVDSSVTPFMRWSDRGTSFSFVGAPSQPYAPDEAAPATRGTSKVLEIPVTIRPRLVGRTPVVGAYVEPRWLRPSRATGSALVSLARDEMARAAREAPARPVVLNAMFHNVEVVAGASPYAATDGRARAILASLETLLAFAQQESIRVVGLASARKALLS